MSGVFLKNDGGTGSGGTGPSQSARGSGGYYIYVETSNGAGLDNAANKYGFLLSNEFTLLWLFHIQKEKQDKWQICQER